MRGIVWFRRDLRLNDQPALTAACGECDEVIPLFVFDKPLLQSHVFGSACVNFMLGCLHDVAASLASRADHASVASRRAGRRNRSRRASMESRCGLLES